MKGLGGQEQAARASTPSSSPPAQPPGISTSKEQRPDAARRERDPGAREGGEARRGAEKGRGQSAGGGRGRRGRCSALAALGAWLCRARCTWARAGTWNGAPIPAQPPR